MNHRLRECKPVRLSAYFFRLTFIFTLAATPNTWAAFQESAGQVVMEAEHFTQNIPRSSHNWTLETSTTGFSGASYLRSLPDNGAIITTGYVTTSPELVYDVNFSTTGTYYVWVRARANLGEGNSLHAGIDGIGSASANEIEFPDSGTWVWTRDTGDLVPATLVVTTTGLHRIHLWMREDGSRVDKLLLRTNSSSTPPSGTGPAESPQTGGTAPTLSITCPADGAIVVASNPCN